MDIITCMSPPSLPPQVLRCSVNDSFLNCTLLVGELEMGPVIVITYSGTTFVPNLPIEFGSVNRVGRQVSNNSNTKIIIIIVH